MTAHGREHERPASARLNAGRQCTNGFFEVGDAPAAYSDGYRGARAYLRSNIRGIELPDNGFGNTIETAYLKMLADARHARQRDIQAAGKVDAKVIDHCGVKIANSIAVERVSLESLMQSIRVSEHDSI
jgi:hypothetical protein